MNEMFYSGRFQIENVHCEMTTVREAFHLMAAGYEPVKAELVDSNGELDHFYFKRIPELLMKLADYRKAASATLSAIDYDDMAKIADIPGSRISPIDDTALEYCFAPNEQMREVFAYELWPVDTRKAYIAADTATRRRMIDEAYGG